MSKRERANFIVYRADRAYNGVPCYIGIGRPERPYDHVKMAIKRSHPNKHLQNIILKAGGILQITVLYTGLSWKEACRIEVELIAFYGRENKGTGPLVNKTDGGDGVIGLVWSEASRMRASLSSKGRKHTTETKRKMSAQRKGQPRPKMRGRTPWNKGVPMTPEQLAKHSSIRIGKSGAPWTEERRAAWSAEMKRRGVIPPRDPEITRLANIGLRWWVTPDGVEYHAKEARSSLDRNERPSVQGKPFTEERRANHSSGAVRGWETRRTNFTASEISKIASDARAGRRKDKV